MKRDAEATRRRILEAAAVEFAEHGIAGARVDRIAAGAESNKQLIYQYFGSKEGLFRTVLARELALASEGVVLAPDRLEEYAGAYFDFAMANPRVMRLIAWSGLEAREPDPGTSPARAKVALIATGQQTGTVADRFAPEFILSAIATLGTAWSPCNWYAKQLGFDPSRDAARHREAIVRLVALMIRPDPQPQIPVVPPRDL